jgi:hypothetical protein
MTTEIFEVPAVCLEHPDGTIQLQRSLIEVTRDERGVITKSEKVGVKTLPEFYVVGDRLEPNEKWDGLVYYKTEDLGEAYGFARYKLIQI